MECRSVFSKYIGGGGVRVRGSMVRARADATLTAPGGGVFCQCCVVLPLASTVASSLSLDSLLRPHTLELMDSYSEG